MPPASTRNRLGPRAIPAARGPPSTPPFGSFASSPPSSPLVDLQPDALAGGERRRAVGIAVILVAKLHRDEEARAAAVTGEALVQHQADFAALQLPEGVGMRVVPLTDVPH